MAKQIKWWLLLALSLIVIIYFVPDSLTFTIDEKLDRYQVEQIATDYLSNKEYDLNDYHSMVQRVTDFTLISYLKSQIEKEKADELFASDAIPNFSWQVHFYKNLPKDQPQTRYFVWISPQGSLSGFTRYLPDTLTLKSVDENEALKIAKSFIENETKIDLSQFTLKKSDINKLTNRSDYSFIWEKPSDFDDGNFRLTIKIQGNKVGNYRLNYEMAEDVQTVFSSEVTRGTFLYLILILILVAIFVYTLILFLKKYHDGEIWVRIGRNLFFIFFFLGLIRSINEFPVTGAGVGIGNMSFLNVQIVTFVYNILLQNVFLGILLLTAWAVGESYARSHWSEKLNSIDSLLNKKFFTLATGNSMLRGGAIGFLVAAIYLAFFGTFTGKDKDIIQILLPFGDIFQFYLPFLNVVLSAIMIALLAEVVFRFFVINVVFHRWQKKWIAILISTIVWCTGYVIFTQYPIASSYWVNIVFILITGLLYSWLYFKYDLLTLIAAQAAANLIFFSIPLFASSAEWHQISTYLLVVAMLFPIAQIIISSIRKQTFQFSDFGLPTHIKRISERERMSKELEIARSVQMGLLPKSSPQIEGFDISGICIPAKEVGGDYFDFVTLGPKKLGIAIGDVSGKGVPAAIYMTLTKGILQSHADETVSPKIVLNKVNRLLYRNIEKNSFVSMFYAVLDISKRELTFARAGHNPGIVVSQQAGESHFLSTDGIALGLEEGSVFDRTLKEHTIELNSGDTLVFYTDGITEAMNELQEEFGETKFVSIISQNRNLKANELIQKIVENVKKFAGEMTQHDDMTIVAVKIL